MANEISVRINRTYPSDHVSNDGIRALDCDVTLTIGGHTHTGGVTLLPRQCDGGYDSWGDTPALWVSGGLLAELQDLDDVVYEQVLLELAATGGAACDAYMQ